MATITSAQSGLASLTSTWTGGILPVEGDKVVIATGHTVTIDGTYTWGDDSVTQTIGNAAVNVSGTLKASRLVNSSLTGKGTILFNSPTNAVLDYGTSADPIPSGVTATLILNKFTTAAFRIGMAATAPTNNAHTMQWTFCGDRSRTRFVTLNTSTTVGTNTCVLTSSAHGWVNGDTVTFVATPTTGSTSVTQRETKLITNVSGATITVDSNFAYIHLANSPVTNWNSNVTVKSYSEVNGQLAYSVFNSSNSYTGAYTITAIDTAFKNFGSGSNVPMFQVGSSYYTNVDTFDRCAFYISISNNVAIYYATARHTVTYTNCAAIAGFAGLSANGNFWFSADNCVLMQQPGSGNGLGYSSAISNTWIDGLDSANPLIADGGVWTNCTFSGRITCFLGPNGITARFYNCDIGYTYGLLSVSGDNLIRYATGAGNEANYYLKNCKLATVWQQAATAAQLTLQIQSNVTYENKQNDVTNQDAYSIYGRVYRENTTVHRGTSCIKITPNNATVNLGRAATKQLFVPCSNGATVRVIGYVQSDTVFYNSGTWTAPTVTLSGLGATPVVFTATSASSGAWQQFDLSITNSAGYDGSFTLTYSATLKTATGGSVSFDGVPDGLYVTKVRHYGFTFDETVPSRTTNALVSASEATAGAYTGVTINSGTKVISFSAGTADTARKFYDYSQYWGVTNIATVMPLVRTGTVYALTTDWSVTEPTYTGITWSGGTITFNTPGTKIIGVDSSTLTFTSSGTYSFGGSLLGGQVTLVNTSGGNVSVQLASGVSYTNTGPNISVTVASSSRTLSLTGLIIGSEVRIYQTSDMTELAGIESVLSDTFSYTYTYTGDIPVTIVIASLSYKDIMFTTTLVDSSSSIPIQQQIDRGYLNP